MNEICRLWVAITCLGQNLFSERLITEVTFPPLHKNFWLLGRWLRFFFMYMLCHILYTHTHTSSFTLQVGRNLTSYPIYIFGCFHIHHNIVGFYACRRIIIYTCTVFCCNFRLEMLFIRYTKVWALHFFIIRQMFNNFQTIVYADLRLPLVQGNFLLQYTDASNPQVLSLFHYNLYIQ